MPAPTVIGLPVIPLLHLIVPPVGHDPVKVAVSYPHTVVLLLAIDGAVGNIPVPMVIGAEATEVPQVFSHTAV